MKVIHLDPTSIIDHWKTIEPAIQSALDHSANESTTYDYLRWLQDPNKYQCWIVLNSDEVIVNITVTRINYYSEHKSLHILTTTGINGGRWDTYKEAHHTIEDYARQLGS